MSIAEKLTQIAENEPKVYEAGKKAEYDRFWDLYQIKGTPGMHHGAFAGHRWNDDTFYPKYDINMRFGSSYAFFFNHVSDIVARLKECGVKLSTKEANNLNNAFNSIKSTTLPTIDVTGEPTKTSSLFAGSTLLKTIEKIVVNEKATYSYWFSQCYALENVVFEGEVGNDLDMKACTLLSKESIINIINCLSDAVTGKKLTLSQTAVENAFPREAESYVELSPSYFHNGGDTPDIDFSFVDGVAAATINGGSSWDDGIGTTGTITFCNALPLSAGEYTVSFDIAGTGNSYYSLYVGVGDNAEPLSPNGRFTFQAEEGEALSLSYDLEGEYRDFVVSVSVKRANAENSEWVALRATKEPEWTITEL